ncbi:phage baseplate assembly protein V [Dichelobacter nodosus]|uniref:phage baseplate assembly protein V n=1 Tax=Dichelobacter nodosus TaxID=870 RepID=UPI000682C8B0|nr:phage baseplate assembly protein V [Dichelobacter nodosus]KNZ39960.1 hypothetical protein AKG33_01030 [Dichelobacter nodosus]
MTFNDDCRRLHNSIVIATVEKIDWEKRKFRARRGEILTNWLEMPAMITANFKYWYPLRKNAQIVMVSPSGDLNTACVIGMLCDDNIPAPEIPIEDRETTELIEFVDGTKIKYDRKTETLELETPCSFKIKAKNIELESTTLIHNGINIGSDHKHLGVMSGTSVTGHPK